MSTTFEGLRTFGASDRSKEILRQLVSKNVFKEMGDAWRLGASLGLSTGNEREPQENENRGTFQNISSLDPDGVFAAIMLGKYPELTPEQRRDKLVSYAEWGIRELNRKHQNSTLKFSKLGK